MTQDSEETNTTRVCTGPEEIRDMAVALIAQAERHIDIFTHNFEPQVYDHDSVRDALETLALRSRHSRVRILVRDPQEMPKRGHRIVELGKFLSSYFYFRVPTRPVPDMNHTFLIADGEGVLHRPYLDSFHAHANFSDRQGARVLYEQFAALWEEAEEHPDFRYLSL